jgi:hypothetical protein
MKLNLKALVGLTTLASAALFVSACSDDKTTDAPAASSVAASSVAGSSVVGSSVVGSSVVGSSVVASSGAISSSADGSSSSAVVAKPFCDGKGSVPTTTTVTAALFSAGDVCLTADKVWTLDGAVVVPTGKTLHIEAGTRVEAIGDTYLQIMAGAKIMAEGTAAKPIIFTSANDVAGKSAVAGDWKGIVVIGKAKVSSADADGMLVSEFDATLRYGGTDDNDNSGVMKYVQINFAGKALSANIEYNSLSLMGVGAGSKFEYIHIHAPKDDGIECWGGNANVKYLVVTEGNDDGFDVDSGFRGSLQYGLILGKKSAIPGADDGTDFGIEIGGDAKNASMPTSIKIDNVTVVTGTNNAKITSAGFQVKKGAKAQISGMVVVQGKDVSSSASGITLTNTVVDAVVDGFWADNSASIGNSFYQGTWTKLHSTTTAATVTKLDAGFKSSTGALNADFSAKDAAIVTAKAGAIVDGNMWYKGWSREAAITGFVLARKARR